MNRNVGSGVQRGIAHYGVFATVGLIAFSVDASLFECFNGLIGLSPLVARFMAVWAAIIVSWLLHRSLTFAMKTPATFQEFLKFVASAWISSAVNYLAFVAILIVWPKTPPFAALVASSLIAACVAYYRMRFSVFHQQ